MKELPRFCLRDILWLILVIGLVIGWRMDHERLRWEPGPEELWIPFSENIGHESIAEVASALDQANVPYAVRDTPFGTVRILVTSSNVDAASAATERYRLRQDAIHDDLVRRQRLLNVGD